MLWRAVFILPFLGMLPSALGCPDHSYHGKTKRAEASHDNVTWAYEASYDWGRLSDGQQHLYSLACTFVDH